jgi:hypothetical protein
MKLSLSFFTGALVPAVALYMTGGSNRFNFLFGLIIGLALALLPLLLWPKRISQWIWNVALACEQFRIAMRERSTPREPRDTPHSRNIEESIKRDQPVAEAKPGHPFAGDCVSALANLGVALGKAQKVVNSLVVKKEYGTFEELFHDALPMAGHR